VWTQYPARLYTACTQRAARTQRCSLCSAYTNGSIMRRWSSGLRRGDGRARVSALSINAWDLTELRAGDKSYAGLNAQSSQVTLKRLDLAFAAFFRRVKAGQTPGSSRRNGARTAARSRKRRFRTDAPLQVRLRADARSERRAGQFAVGAEQPWPGTGPKRHPVPACGLGSVVHGPSITRTKFCGWMYAAKAL
jgi:hypothetical protein